MYKLTIVVGPSAGTSFALHEGEVTIGRQTGNVIVLASSKVSKRHCRLVVDGGKVLVSDSDSANGTFVNGALTRSKVVEDGDKIGVGEYVLELTRVRMREMDQAPALSGGNVIAFPNSRSAAEGNGFQSDLGIGPDYEDGIKGKIVWHFENYVMPFFYSLNLKYEYRFVIGAAFAAFILLTIAISIFPLLEANEQTVITESGRRARLIARELVMENSEALGSDQESNVKIGAVADSVGVKFALVMRLDRRIIAPSNLLNQYFVSGPEAAWVEEVSNHYRKDGEKPAVKYVGNSSVVAIEPVKVFDSRFGRNVVNAMAVVAIDTSLSTPDIGTIGVIYSSNLIIVGVIGILLALILYRFTLRRFELLNEDIDRVLKGEIDQVTNEFQFEELDQLWEIINSTVQRVAKSKSGGGSGEEEKSSGASIDEFSEAFKVIGENSLLGIVLCDAKKIVRYVSPQFEEVVGVHAMNVFGQDVMSLARDDAFSSLLTEMFNQAASGGQSSEDYEISGIPFSVKVTAIGSFPVRGFVLVLKRKGQDSSA